MGSHWPPYVVYYWETKQKEKSVAEKKDTDTEVEEEIGAMTSVAKALSGLAPDARERVLRWASGRFNVEWTGVKGGRKGETGEVQGEQAEFADFPSLFDAAAPNTDPERALVAGYWFQQVESRPDLDAQTLNTALKNLGHPIANITDALSSLKNRKPALVMQTQKKGTTRQARKKYKLTTAGVKAVEAMLAHEG